MPSATSKGYPYPLATDPVAAGASDIQALAEYTDVRPMIMAAGTVAVSWAAAASSGTAAVTFPAGRFPFAPAVLATVTGGTTNYLAGAGSITTTGMTVVGFQKDSTAGAVTITVHWIARSNG